MAKSRAKKKGQQPFPRVLLLILFFMAVISVVGLDYINWTSGKTSFLFAAQEAAQDKAPQEEAAGPPVLAEIVLKQIDSLSVPVLQKSQFWGTDGIFHLKVDMTEKGCRPLKTALEEEFAAFGAVIEKRRADEEEKKIHYLWLVTNGGGERMSLLLSCSKTTPPPEKISEPVPGRGKMAIILDDMGYNLQAINDIVRLNQKVTISILPNTPHCVETAEIAREKGLEILLHLPMESDNAGSVQNKVPGIILSSMKKRRIVQVFADDLKQVPYAKGVNNHMGSKITRDREIMAMILEQVKKNRLFFVDSLTTGDSLAYETAKSMGIPAAERHVFLDGILTEEYITVQMEELFHKARRMGGAIGICHPSDVTFKFLSEKLPEIGKYGLELVFVSALVK
jgi:polysaccharide deacetylase 2 family uncharacterized protein YibQ